MSVYASVKICFDTGCALSRKLDPATFLRDLGPEHLCQVHFHDLRLGKEGRPPDWNVALGAGDVDFPAVASAISAMGYEGWIIVEGPASENPPATAKADLAFARRLLTQR